MKYQDMQPYMIDKVLKETPVAYIPWGALEWHGKHLAIGNDGLKAEAICYKAAERTGGVVLPTIWMGYQTMQLYGFRRTLEFRKETVQQVLTEFLGQLSFEGFRVIVVLTGHYGWKHLAALKETASHFSSISPTKVWVFAEYEVVPEDVPPELNYRGDHAAKWETSILMYLRPELVDMSRLSPDLNEKLEGVGGEDPRISASPELGEKIVKIILEGIEKKVKELLEETKG